MVHGQKLDAQVMAPPLSVYVTNQELAGTVATSYGFKVTPDGASVATLNVGTDGAAVGKANGTVMGLMDILLATDVLSASDNGLLYSGDVAKRNAANDLYITINTVGNIG